MEIIVSLRMDASAEAPLSPISFHPILQSMGKVGAVSNQGVDTKSNTRGGGAPERGHGAPLEPLAQLGYAQGGVGTLDIAIIILVEAAELVAIQAAKGRRGVSMGADTKANALGRRRTPVVGSASP